MKATWSRAPTAKEGQQAATQLSSSQAAAAAVFSEASIVQSGAVPGTLQPFHATRRAGGKYTV